MLHRRSEHPDIRTKFIGHAGHETRWRSALACITTVFLAGCSLHPVQQDVTGVRTAELVQYIRCESRLAIQDKAIALFRKEDEANPLIGELSALRGRQ